MTPLVAAAFLLWVALTGLHDIPLIVTGLILCFCLDRILSISLPWKQFVYFLWLLTKSIFVAYKEAFVKDAQTGNYTLTTNNATLQRLEQNVQNNAANYTDDILKTNLPALYARTNREDAV